ncbi:MAG: GNAT family N-acetyltransferase [Treponema sp.]|nr:GNAT family N-acetyltransferase [Treponema sp.]
MLIFELLDGDWLGFSQVRQQVLDFLLANEHKCVALVSHFQKKDTKILYILDERNVIWGVLSVSESGQILHCLESETVLGIVEAYFQKFRPQKIFSIIGEKKYTDAIAKIFQKLYGTVNKSATEYSLMEYNALLAEEAALAEKPDNKKRHFLNSCEIFDCKNSDFDEMLPIQKAYELEEVVIDRESFNEQSCRILLRRNIQSGIVFGVRYNNRIIAKASINAEGENCIQLGGIYTDISFRNKGIATYLVRTLSNRFKKNKKDVVLFVKNSNSTAINVYTNCGYTPFGDYKIIYY